MNLDISEHVFEWENFEILGRVNIKVEEFSGAQ